MPFCVNCGKKTKGDDKLCESCEASKVANKKDKSNDMWECKKCRAECKAEANVCWSCGAKRNVSQSVDVVLGEDELNIKGTTGNAIRRIKRSPLSRYQDAYLSARGMTAFGSTVKMFAMVVLALMILVGFVVASQSGGAFFMAFTSFAAAGIGFSICLYILGILISAQGQILKATLDTAVNSSPFLTKDEMKEVMSWD